MGNHLGVASQAMKTYGQKARAAGNKIAELDLASSAGRLAARYRAVAPIRQRQNADSTALSPCGARRFAEQGDKVAGEPGRTKTPEEGKR